jgi:hypothetical protein
MKVLIYTAMNTRHTVSELWCLGISRFIAAAPEGIECSVMAVISEAPSEEILNRFGFGFVFSPNQPLGNKFNRGLTMALEAHEFDYLMLMGDDDLISAEAWHYYLPLIQSGMTYFGFHSIYFYSPTEGKALAFDYRNTGPTNKLIGCGRMFHRSALEAVAYQQPVAFIRDYTVAGANFAHHQTVWLPVYQAEYFIKMGLAEAKGDVEVRLWNPTQVRGLDNESEVRLLLNGYMPFAIDTPHPVMTDVKTEANIWAFNNFLSVGTHCSVDEATAYLGEAERAFLQLHFVTAEALECVRVPLNSSPQKMQDTVHNIVSEAFNEKFKIHTMNTPRIAARQSADNNRYTEYWVESAGAAPVFLLSINAIIENEEMAFYIDRDETKARFHQVEYKPMSVLQ